MVAHIRTKDIIDKYDISRQTLYNWIHEGLIKEPQKDWRGWRIWNNDCLKAIEKLISEKVESRNIAMDNTELFFEIYNRRYLGSKQKLIEFIDSVMKEKVSEFNTFFEPFGGTGAISNYYNSKNKNIIINDLLKSNFISYNTFFGNEKYDEDKIGSVISKLNKYKVKKENYFSNNFGNRYFTLDNSRKIGFIRDYIDKLFKQKDINQREKDILITSLIFAADKVANTCGHYDAYREKMDSTKDLQLLMPHINNSVNIKNKLYNCDANLLSKKIISDVTYIDTPYNSRQYCDAYHLLENIALNNKPEVIGKAKKMKDRKNIKSNYCTVKAVDSFNELINNLNTEHILVSYNNMASKGNGRSNAKISNEEIIEILSSKGEVEIFSTDYNAFTTGKSKIDNHKELIYYCKVFKES
ncbi:DNA methyltransferase [Clostridium botulinum]|nr:DNA methyltransferase [Clostridium botulinum]